MYRLINYPNHPLEVPTWALGEGFSNYNIDEFVQKWTFGDRKPFFSTFSHILTFLYSKFQMIVQIHTIPLQNMLSQVNSSKIGLIRAIKKIKVHVQYKEIYSPRKC